MNIKTLMVWGLILTSLLNATELEREYEAIIKQKVSACQKITSLDGLYAIAKNEPKLGAKILLSIGTLAMKMGVSLEAYQKQPQMQSICHLKVVKSANYGDFTAYDGYHFRELIKHFPNSNLIDDAQPSLYNGTIAWYGGASGDDKEVYYWDGFSISQVTDNDFDDLQVSLYGNSIAWYGYDGDDFEIYYATQIQPIPDAPTIILLSSSLLALAGFRRKFKK